jgi:urea carboxylase
METRFTFGGDDHILCVCAEAMSLDAFFKSLTATRLLRESGIGGITEVLGSHAAYMVRFDPDLIHPDDMLRETQAIDRIAAESEPVMDTRIIEVPVYYDDPWSRETMQRFSDRRQDPTVTDLEYAARVNGHPSVASFIAAHHGSPWFVSLVGFVCGVPSLFQLVERGRQIQTPKYVRPRTDTPRHVVGHGGAFCCIYAVRGAGGYQMFGIIPMPIFDPTATVRYMDGEMVFCRPGDLVKFKPIDGEEYDADVAAVEENRFKPRIREVRFDLREFERDMDAYNRKLVDMLYVD